MTSRKAILKPPSKNVTPSPAATTSTGPKDPSLTVSYFPFARYTSALGVHSSLLTFTALFLPRTSLTSLVDFLANRTTELKEHDLHRGAVLKTLTEDPPRTLAWICAGGLVLQLWWGIWMRKWSFEANILRKAAKDTDQTSERALRGAWNARRFTALRDACLGTLAVSFVFHVIIILFGGPILSHSLHTYLLGLLVSLLTTFVPTYTLGPPSLYKSDSEALIRRMTWVRLFAELSPRSPFERAVVYPTVGTFLGCWFGAIPLGLDWERPWQAWPLTPAYGAISGYILGSLFGLAVNGVYHLAELDLVAQREARDEIPAQVKKEGLKAKRK